MLIHSPMPTPICICLSIHLCRWQAHLWPSCLPISRGSPMPLAGRLTRHLGRLTRHLGRHALQARPSPGPGLSTYAALILQPPSSRACRWQAIDGHLSACQPAAHTNYRGRYVSRLERRLAPPPRSPVAGISLARPRRTSERLPASHLCRPPGSVVEPLRTAQSTSRQET